MAGLIQIVIKIGDTDKKAVQNIFKGDLGDILGAAALLTIAVRLHFKGQGSDINLIFSVDLFIGVGGQINPRFHLLNVRSMILFRGVILKVFHQRFLSTVL